MEKKPGATRSWRLERFSVKVEPLQPLDISLRQVWFRAERSDALAFGKQSYAEYRVIGGNVYTREASTPLPAAERRARETAFKEDCQRFLRQGSSYWHEVSLPEIEGNLERLQRSLAAGGEPRELAGVVREAVAIYERHWEIHWHLGAEFAIERFVNTYRELTHGSDNDARGLLAGVETMTTRLVAGLRELAALASIEDAEALRAGAVPENPEFKAALTEFLERFGLRIGAGYGSGTTLREPTWIEDPAPVLRLVASYMESGPRTDATANSTISIAHLGAGRARAARIKGELEAARAANGLLEDHNYYIEQMTGGLLRLAIMRLADALVDSGHLAARDDVFFLYLNELINAPEVPPEFIRDRVFEHRHQWQLWSRSEPADELVGDEPAQAALAQPSEPLRGGPLKGVGASPGVAVGRAHVVLDRQALPALAPGEILVARNAGPLWSPLLPLLSALVLDEGALLQHAALLAREYKVPAVFMTGHATTSIPDGAKIRVDGVAGTVSFEP
jgi:phosphohistidine swiveling domain-containing protein